MTNSMHGYLIVWNEKCSCKEWNKLAMEILRIGKILDNCQIFIGFIEVIRMIVKVSTSLAKSKKKEEKILFLFLIITFRHEHFEGEQMNKTLIKFSSHCITSSSILWHCALSTDQVKQKSFKALPILQCSKSTDTTNQMLNLRTSDCSNKSKLKKPSLCYLSMKNTNKNMPKK